MSNLWVSIMLSLVTGAVASSLVVIYFEMRQNRKYALSRSHILERFSRELFHVLTTIRVASQLKLENVSLQSKTEVVKELERVLGRNDPSVLMARIPNLSAERHRYIFNQLTEIHNSLSTLFSQSIGHKTIEDKISASIAETQEWISSVLYYYVTFPELIDRKSDQTIHMVWMTSIFNLVENSFAILSSVLRKQTTPEGSLRWGSRTK